MRKKGDTLEAQEVRRHNILRMVIIGLRNHEILEQLQKAGTRISEATLKRDIAAVRDDLKAHVEKAELHSIRTAFNEFDLLWRELWSIFYGPPPKNQQGETHRAFWRPVIADRLIKVAEHKARLAGYLASPNAPTGVTVDVRQQVVLDAILEDMVRKLPPDEQEVLAKAIRDIERRMQQAN